jgi:hypothetical protein
MQSTLLHTKIASVLSAALALSTAQSSLAYEQNDVLNSGTGANQASEVFHDSRTLLSGANEVLDLNGVLSDALGVIVSFTKVKILLIRNKGTTVLTVGGAATNGFISPFGTATDTVKVQPGGMLVLFAPDVNGYGVTAATADQLKIANAAGASCTYDIVIVGA